MCKNRRKPEEMCFLLGSVSILRQLFFEFFFFGMSLNIQRTKMENDFNYMILLLALKFVGCSVFRLPKNIIFVIIFHSLLLLNRFSSTSYSFCITKPI